jgi:hypothetical protein
MAEIGKQSELPAGEPIGIYSTTGRPADEPQAQPINPEYDVDTAAEMLAEIFPGREPKEILREHGLIADLEFEGESISDEEREGYHSKGGK